MEDISTIVVGRWPMEIDLTTTSKYGRAIMRSCKNYRYCYKETGKEYIRVQRLHDPANAKPSLMMLSPSTG